MEVVVVAKEIVLADSYIDSWNDLGNRARSRVRKSLDKFATEEKTPGFQIHSLDRINCDDSFRSARVNRDLRLIFSQQGDKNILLYVDHHDDAYNWAKNKYFKQNRFGALYVYDNQIELTEEQKESLSAEEINELYDTRSSLLEKQDIRAKDLTKLDINQVEAEYLMEIKDEDKFIAFISKWPEEIQEALFDLVTGNKSITQVCMELEDQSVEEELSLVESLEQKDSKRRFYTVDDLEELDHILESDMEKWRIFLHPQQEEIVSKDYSGPALIEGGPGTGKTVVGMHRAVYLSQHHYPANKDYKILFCTFSKKLAFYISDKLTQLVEQKDITNNIDVYGVDSLIYKLVKQNNLTDFDLDIEKNKEIFEDLYQNFDLEYSIEFYKTEYKEVIQRNQIENLEQYLAVSRLGRGKALHAKRRKKAWQFFKEYLAKKEAAGIIDFEDQAAILYQALKQGNLQAQYDSIIIDEAQDLSPVKLKLLAELSRQDENNLMLLSDSNQRIYQLKSWKEDAGINIVGRTNYLTLNYRTTEEIRKYADSQFVHSDSKDYMKDYKSLLNGPEPEVKSFKTAKEEYQFLINKLKKLLESDVKPYEIGIITYSSDEFGKIEGVLEYEGIEYTILQKEHYPKAGTGVGITTLHGSKGLEFKTVFLLNYDKIISLLDQEDNDEWYQNNKLKQIECLKYVACTRPREELIISSCE